MKFKTPFKALTTAALIGTLAVSSVAPNAAFAETKAKADTNQQAEFALKEVVLKKGDSYIQVPLSTYTSAVKNKALNGYTVYAVVAQNGTVVPLSVYTAYLKGLQTTTPAVAIAAIADAKKDIEAPADVKPGKVENGQLVPGEETSTEADLKVEEISAINNKTFEFQVSFSQDVAEAKPATLKLGDVTVVAQPTKTEGKVVTYTVKTEDQDKLVTGNYAVTIDGLKSIAQTANYEKLVTETSITGVAVESNETDGVYADLKAKQLAGVTATVDGKSVTTNAFGYFNFGNVTPGKKEIVFKKAGYFTHRATVDTKRSNETSYAAELEQRVKAKYAIEGTIVNAEDSQPVADDVEVTLQREVNGEWVDVKNATGEAYTAKTKDGKYAFVNSSAAEVTADPTATTEVSNALDYAEDGSIKYRVVANKDISSTNFTEVYDNQVSPSFTLSDEKATTTPAVFKANKVKELKDLDLSVVWNELAKTSASAKTAIKVTLIDKDGETPLVAATELADVKEADKATLKDEKAINLVDKGIFKENSAAVTPRVPVGTYFLKVDDDVAGNATPYVAVKVTEEGQVVKLNAEVTEAASLTPSVSVPTTKYNAVYNLTGGETAVTDNTLLAATATNFNAATDETITSDVKTVLNLDGAKVVVNKSEDKGFNYNKDDKAVSASVTKIDRLPAGKYSVTTDNGEYVTNAESTEVSLAKGGSTNKTVEVAGLGKATIKVVEDASGNAAITGISKIELLDATTGEVVESTAATFNADGTINTTASNEFANIEPGEYKVKVSAPGYESKTSDKFTVYDFQYLEDAVTVKLKAGEEFTEPVVQGIALYADDNTPVYDAANTQKATITAYTTDGKYVAKADVATDGSYTFNDDLAAGKTFKLVLRLDGKAETTVQEVTVPTASKSIKTVDFTNVVKGGEAKYEVIIVDAKNNPVTTSLSGKKLYLQDEYASLDYASQLTNVTGYVNGEEPTKEQVDAAKALTLDALNLSTVTNDGYQLLAPAAGSTANLYETDATLSAGAHTVVIQEGTTTKAYAATVSIQKDATVDGGVIKLQLKDNADGSLTYNVEGTVTNATGTAPLATETAGANGYVLAISTKDNSVVASSGIDENGVYKLEELPNNTAYRLVTVINGGFVASKTVTVQDRNLTNQNIAVTEASR